MSSIVAPHTASTATTGIQTSLSKAVSRCYSSEIPGKHRVKVPALSLDPFQWLSEQKPDHRLFWSGRDDETWYAAAGVASLYTDTDINSLPETLRDIALEVNEPDSGRYFGGMRFDAVGRASDEWESFGAYRFVLPRFELIRTGTHQSLVCNFDSLRESRESVLDSIREMTIPYESFRGFIPPPESRRDDPDPSSWTSSIESLLESFDSGEAEKVVLARRAGFHFSRPVDPVALLKHLVYTKPGCFHFLFQTDESAAFVSATPERLYWRDGRSLYSEAVAGTRPRGNGPVADEVTGRELLESEKDQREHAYVRDSISRGLTPLCTDLVVEQRASIMTLSRRLHLVSRVTGTLKPDVSDADVIKALHPTPAVGGFPTAQAFSAIRNHETFDRGWYAGPIGWIGSEGAEFGVGIRSGLVRDSRVDLYAGAGIVRGSTADGEWDEIEEKLGDFLEVLGFDL